MIVINSNSNSDINNSDNDSDNVNADDEWDLYATMQMHVQVQCHVS